MKRIFTDYNSRVSYNRTMDYITLEILLHNDNKEENLLYTLAINIWSLGCMLFYLLI